VLVEKEDLTGKDRRRVRDQGTALAGKSTLNRMELFELPRISHAEWQEQSQSK
jgi:hypothetical protein